MLGIFSGLLTLISQTLDVNLLIWQQTPSEPGLGFQPQSPESLIWYNVEKRKYVTWTNKLDEFLKPYREPYPHFENLMQTCDFDTPETSDKACKVDIRSWAPCIKESNYGYHNGAPCIFLKLDKIKGWMPEFYNDTDTLPQNMPEDLKSYITEIKRRNPKSLNTVWVSCEGENPADVENIGSIQYIPRRGFPGFYFPYKNQEGYLSPVIAIWFEKPVKDNIINIECKAWARNIHHDREERRGSVNFKLMIDSSTL